MSTSPVVRLIIASLSFGGGVAAGLLAASVASREAQRRHVTGPAHTQHFGDPDHLSLDEIEDVAAPVDGSADLFESADFEAGPAYRA